MVKLFKELNLKDNYDCIITKRIHVSPMPITNTSSIFAWSSELNMKIRYLQPNPSHWV